jgi:hypothetical protein
VQLWSVPLSLQGLLCCQRGCFQFLSREHVLL